MTTPLRLAAHRVTAGTVRSRRPVRLEGPVATGGGVAAQPSYQCLTRSV